MSTLGLLISFIVVVVVIYSAIKMFNRVVDREEQEERDNDTGSLLIR